MIAVLNTRPREQAPELSRMLREAGYHSVEVPLVELALLDEGMAELSKLSIDDYDGILFSSPNLLSLLQEKHSGLIDSLISKPWYLISGKIRKDAEQAGAKVAFVPHETSLEGFLREFPRLKNLRLLHPCSRATRLDPKLFAAGGITIRNVAVYAPNCPEDAASRLQAVWSEIRTVLFASGSAVRNLFAAAPELARSLNFAEGPASISIGPSATEALRSHGVAHFIQAPTADNAGLIAALRKKS
ncbi:MAG TPA: hypothetical protein DCQ83_09025 [Fibrobacteres bacterium]|jgi:uroporphyrinogen-III synthase|nr:hypothetical protein [Fibrobacterota bacterium]